MKKFILSICLALPVFAHAQFQIGSAQIPTGGRAGSLSDDDLATFKKTTTIFVVQARDKARIADFEKSIKDVWKITPFKVVTADATGSYLGKQYSVFTFGGFTITHTSSSGMSTTNTHISYDLTIPDYNRRGENKGRTILARFVLSPDFATVSTVSRQGGTFEGRRRREEREDEQASQLDNRAKYTNWGPGQIRGYLKSINDYLTAGDRRGLFDGVLEKDQIKQLAKDTLYLPNYLKDRFNAFTGDETTKEDDDANEDLNKAYPFPHRYVNEDELERMIVNSTKPIYHLIYVRSSTNKYVSVVEGHSGTIIYSDFANLSYNFKMKDLKKLANRID